MSKNVSLNMANTAKYDEFYTELSDIENELRHYARHFRNKTVLCNCDDPRISKFFHYFSYNFKQLKLKKLIATCYKSRWIDQFSTHDSERAVYQEYDGDEDRIPNPRKIKVRNLKGDGDFRSDECTEILEKADIVVTNPPFSLFREYVLLLMRFKKKFLIIGNINVVTYKEIFPLIKNDQMWYGHYAGPMKFKVPEHNEPKSTDWTDENGQKWRSLGNICWFTNLDTKKRHESLVLYKKYNRREYPKYDNYDAINVDKVRDIPVDYDEVMGVPINFMDKYNPDQFEILGCDYNVKQGLLPELVRPRWKGHLDRGYVNGKRLYFRIFIRRREH